MRSLAHNNNNAGRRKGRWGGWGIVAVGLSGERERQILWDSGEDFVQTRQGSLGKGSDTPIKSDLKHRKLSHVES